MITDIGTAKFIYTTVGLFVGFIIGAFYMRAVFKLGFEIWTRDVLANYRKGIENLKKAHQKEITMIKEEYERQKEFFYFNK